jgi:hypothetical protein
MPRVEPPLRSAYPDDFIDSLANLTTSVLQEQLAPIFQTLREHANLIDVLTALLNHSTEMNRYNVGKIEDIRDFQNNIKYLAFFPLRLLPRSPNIVTVTNANVSSIQKTDSIPSIRLILTLQPALCRATHPALPIHLLPRTTPKPLSALPLHLHQP